MSITPIPNQYPSVINGFVLNNALFSGKTNEFGVYKYSGTLTPGYYFYLGNNAGYFGKANYIGTTYSRYSTQSLSLMKISANESNFTLIISPIMVQSLYIINGITMFHDGTNYWVRSGITGLLGTAYKSTDSITWSSVNVGFGTTAVNCGVYNASVTNKYILVGNAGTLTTSTDGVTWTSRTSGFGTSNIQFTAINSSATNKYIAVGAGGTITTSTDGVTWTSRTSGVTPQLVSVATNGTASTNQIYVAVGNNTLITSTDGVTWTSRTAPGGNINFYNVTWANGFYWLNGDYELYNSTDGITWNWKYSATAALSGVFYINSAYWLLASYSLYYSTDGNRWDGIYMSAPRIKQAAFSSTKALFNYYTTFSGLAALYSVPTPQEY